MRKRICKWKNESNEVQVKGDVYYLDVVSGSDSNNGLSTSQAFKSQSYAESIMSNGDVLLPIDVGQGETPSVSQSEFRSYKLNDVIFKNYENIYYLDQVNGDNGEDGTTYEKAWETMAYALANTSEGDLVIVYSGNYGDVSEAANTDRTDFVEFQALWRIFAVLQGA